MSAGRSKKRKLPVGDHTLSTPPEDNKGGSGVVGAKVHASAIKALGGLRAVVPLQRKRTSGAGNLYCSGHGTTHKREKFNKSYRVKEEDVDDVNQRVGCDVKAGDLVCDAFYHKFLHPSNYCSKELGGDLNLVWCASLSLSLLSYI